VTSIFTAASVTKQLYFQKYSCFVATFYKAQNSQSLEKQTITKYKTFIFIKKVALVFSVAFVSKQRVSSRHPLFIVVAAFSKAKSHNYLKDK
jgi:hypothetical protein